MKKSPPSLPHPVYSRVFSLRTYSSTE